MRFLAGRTVILLTLMGTLAACAASVVVPSDPGRPLWSGTIACEKLSVAECNAGATAVIAAVTGGSLRPIGLSLTSGPACPPGTPDCSYALLPGQRLLGSARIEFEGLTKSLTRTSA